MSDFVEFRGEALMPELEQMEKIHLFNKNEIRQFAKNRKEFEYKLRSKNKEEYLKYINHELDLLKTISKRREENGINLKTADIDFAIAERLNKLFKQMLSHFQDDVRLWLFYIKFCKEFRSDSCIRQMLARMLQVHGHIADLWLLVAKWEYEESQSIDGARQYFLRGIRHHPQSVLLYTEAFRLELDYTEKNIKEAKALEAEKEAALAANNPSSTNIPNNSSSTTSNNPNSSNSIITTNPNRNSSSNTTMTNINSNNIEMMDTSNSNGDDCTEIHDAYLAQVIYEQAITKVHNVAFVINLLKIATQYDFTTLLQNKIVGHLLAKYHTDEMTWDIIARRELEGLSYNTESIQPTEPEASENTSQKDKQAPNKKLLKERIILCCAVYERIVKELSTEKMWSMYIDTLTEVNQDLVHFAGYKRKILKDALQGAHDAEKLQEKYYAQWGELLQSCKNTKPKKLGSMLRIATERFPHNVELWCMRLRFHFSRDRERAAMNVFADACVKLGAEDGASLPLWKMRIHYYQTKSSLQVETAFLEGLRQPPSIAHALKPMFLEWLVLSKGIKAARKEYEQLVAQPPLCLEMHQKMAFLELIQPSPSFIHIRRCHEYACQQFGQSNSDLWMDYLKFEHTDGDPNNIPDLYNRAIQNLDPMQSDIFVREFKIKFSSECNANQSNPSNSSSKHNTSGQSNAAATDAST